MKITKHITFYYDLNRIKYINQIIDETNKYKYQTDIFIHTNVKDLKLETFRKYENGKLEIIYHDLTGINHHYLTWKCRDLLKFQKDDYDIFMYIEDDILVPKKAIDYWLTYNEKLIANNYNLGFLRIEVKDNEEFVTDIIGHLDKSIILENQMFSVNDKNPYCAFWIYNKNEFLNFINSNLYDLNTASIGYGIRESSAIGMHGVHNNYYKNTIIPLEDNSLDSSCRIYHLPNNYAYSNLPFAKTKFKDVFIPNH